MKGGFTATFFCAPTPPLKKIFAKPNGYIYFY